MKELLECKAKFDGGECNIGGDFNSIKREK